MELGTWNTWDSFYPQEKLPLRYNNSLEVHIALLVATDEQVNLYTV